MRFTKMQGCGNDYVCVDCFSETVDDPAALARMISDRHYGVGGDGLILIGPSAEADAYMRIFNRDGSEGCMCGNGVRCAAKYLHDHGVVSPERSAVRIGTRAGVRDVELIVAGGEVVGATVDMGMPRLTSALPERISVLGMELSFIGVDMGNPHAVYFLEDNPALGVSSAAALALDGIGPAFETHERFPDGVNSEFVEILAPSEVNFRVWERGSGRTLACGTGASAAVYAGIMAGKLANEVTVHLSGGNLQIRYDPAGGRCFMAGPAVEVFTGELVARKA